jgi:hypothetical protein
MGSPVLAVKLVIVTNTCLSTMQASAALCLAGHSVFVDNFPEIVIKRKYDDVNKRHASGPVH